MNRLFRWLINRAAHRAIDGRRRSPLQIDSSRFSPQEVDHLLKQVWEAFRRDTSGVSSPTNTGNRSLIQLARLSLNCLEVLVAAGIQRTYAIVLIGDTAWLVYQKWGRLSWAFSRLYSADPRNRLERSVSQFLQFPFSAPGYTFELIDTESGVGFNILRCQVADFMIGVDAVDLCVETWCSLDYSLAAQWQSTLERSCTIVEGCESCDFRFTSHSIES